MSVILSAAKNLFPQMPAKADMQTSPDQQDTGTRIANARLGCFRGRRHGKSLREPAFEVEDSSLQLGLNSGGAQVARTTARNYGQRGSWREH